MLSSSAAEQKSGHVESKAADFDDLLRDSREMMIQCRAAPSLSTGMYDEMMLPTLQRGPEQIQVASSRLPSTLIGASSRGYNHIIMIFKYLMISRSALLASEGFDQVKLVEQLEKISDLSSTALEVIPSEADPSDLDSFLESKFEDAVLQVVEKLQNRVKMESERLIQAAKDANWERVKRSYLEKRQVISKPLSTTASTNNSTNTMPTVGSTPMLRRRAPITGNLSNEKSEAYLRVIKKLNESRLSGTSFSPALSFKAVASKFEGDPKTEMISDCWQSLATIVDEHPIASEEDNVFLASNPKSFNLNTFSPTLIQGSRKFLEAQFCRYLDATISMYPREAMLGGRPGIIDRVKAFVNIRLKRMSQGELDKLEIGPGGLAHWLILFYLLRAGWKGEALEWAQSMESVLQRSEPCFVAYLKAYVNGSMTSGVIAQLRSDYAQRSLSHTQDPYKLTLLKIIGRCDLVRKSLPDVIQTSEDYLWLQLGLLGEGYELAELQKIVLGYGAAHFDPKGMAPLRYFQILLLVGLFEDATAFLYETNYQLESIHFIITLAYYDLLKVVDDPAANLWDVKLSSGKLNCGSILSQWSKLIAQSCDQFASLQYIFLITLIPGHAYTNYCHDQVRSMILSTTDAASLLGDIRQDGSVQPGYLTNHAKLLKLTDTASFMAEITVKAAEKCAREGRLPDALQLFNLAGEYSRVLQLLAKRLQLLITSPYQADDASTVTAMSEAILQYYQSQERILSKLDAGQVENCEGLLALVHLRKAVEEGSWAEAVNLLEINPILKQSFPMSDDQAAGSVITRAADRFRTNNALSACLPEALLLIMQALHGRFQALREFALIDPGRQAELDRVRRQARSVMLLVGLVRMRIQPEVCAQLTRLDIMMN